jgi:hypothetical protein
MSLSPSSHCARSARSGHAPEQPAGWPAASPGAASRRLSSLPVFALLVVAGCGTPNVNPAAPKANTGYVDFYTEASLELSWEVKLAESKIGKWKTAFSEFNPIEGTILRLAAPAGSQRFQVWFMNRATEGPQIVQVEVENGKVTPVHITLRPAGMTSIDTKVYGFRGSAKGFGRGTKIATDEDPVYRIIAIAANPQPYRMKEQMPYFTPVKEESPATSP